MSALSLALALGLALVPAAEAREAIAVLRSDELPEYDEPVDAFVRGVGAPVEVFALKGDKATARRIAQKLAADPPPAVLALGAKAAWIASQELPAQVPVVWAMVRDPERYGLDGINLTGVRMEMAPSMVLAQFQLFAPDARRIGILLSASNSDPFVGEAIQAAKDAGFEVKARRVTSARDVRRQAAGMLREVDALWLLPDPLVVTPSNFHFLRSQATRSRKPLLAYSETLVDAGALMCVAADREAIGRTAAGLVRQILDENLSPGTVEPVLPSRTRVVLNRDTQEAIGLRIDPAMMDFVDQTVRARSDR
jgi:ABC-type uncharacterized transport system substrate-binding protein